MKPKSWKACSNRSLLFHGLRFLFATFCLYITQHLLNFISFWSSGHVQNIRKISSTKLLHLDSWLFVCEPRKGISLHSVHRSCIHVILSFSPLVNKLTTECWLSLFCCFQRLSNVPSLSPQSLPPEVSFICDCLVCIFFAFPLKSADQNQLSQQCYWLSVHAEPSCFNFLTGSARTTVDSTDISHLQKSRGVGLQYGVGGCRRDCVLACNECLPSIVNYNLSSFLLVFHHHRYFMCKAN